MLKVWGGNAGQGRSWDVGAGERRSWRQVHAALGDGAGERGASQSGSDSEDSRLHLGW